MLNINLLSVVVCWGWVGPKGNETTEEKLTKYEVGANPNPPKKPRRSPKKGKVTPTNNVNAAIFQELLSGFN